MGMLRAGRRGAVVALMLALGASAAGCAAPDPASTATPGPAGSSSSATAGPSTPAASPSTRAAAPSTPPAVSPSPSSPGPSAPSPSATTPSPTPTEPFDSYLAYVTASRLNLRAGASTATEVGGQLTRGDRVRVIGRDRNGFTPIRHDGDDFWVTAGYLSTTKPDPLPRTTGAPVRTMYPTTSLNVRTSPATDAEVLGTLAAGEKITTAGAVAGGWTSIAYQGGTGWVRSQYLTTTRPTPSPADDVSLDARCMKGLVVCISKGDRELRLVQDGSVLISLDARFGSEAGPTREGTFSIEWRSKDWVSTLYHSKMPYAMFFSGGEAIHYSSDFAARGYDGNSHGCVNIRSWDGIQYLWDHAPVGTTVVVYQ